MLSHDKFPLTLLLVIVILFRNFLNFSCTIYILAPVALSNKVRCWDNHVTLLSSKDTVNTNSANLNSIYKINRNSFFNKFSGSTFIQMLGYYDISIKDWTDEMKKVLCVIDGLFEAFFVYKIDFRPTQIEYLKQLEYWEDLKNILQNTQRSEFYDIKYKYKLDGKIIVDENGYLQTDIKLKELSLLFNVDFNLPQKQFKKFRKYDKYTVDLKSKYLSSRDSLLNDGESFFNVALTNKNFMVYSKK